MSVIVLLRLRVLRCLMIAPFHITTLHDVCLDVFRILTVPMPNQRATPSNKMSFVAPVLERLEPGLGAEGSIVKRHGPPSGKADAKFCY